MKTNWLVVIVMVLVGTVAQGQPRLYEYRPRGNSYGGGYSSYDSYGYGQRSGAELTDQRTGVSIRSTGLLTTLGMRDQYNQVLDISSSERKEHYSELPKTQLGIDVAEIAKRQRAEEAAAKMAAENARLKAELAASNAVKAQKVKELADLKKAVEENKILRQELQKAQAKK